MSVRRAEVCERLRDNKKEPSAEEYTVKHQTLKKSLIFVCTEMSSVW